MTRLRGSHTFAAMRCAGCNAAIDLSPGERVGFRDCCDTCGGDLHICHNCEFHDPSAYNECREPGAERVGDPERANRCDWFQPADRSGGAGREARSDALSALDSLFKKD